MTGPALPAMGPARTTLRNDIANSVRAWLAPMRTFTSDINDNMLVTACDDPAEPGSMNYDCLQDDSYFDPDARRVIVLTAGQRAAEGGGREHRQRAGPFHHRPRPSGGPCPEAQVIHLAPGVGFHDCPARVRPRVRPVRVVYAEDGFFCDIHHGNYAPSSTSVMCNAKLQRPPVRRRRGHQARVLLGVPRRLQAASSPSSSTRIAPGATTTASRGTRTASATTPAPATSAAAPTPSCPPACRAPAPAAT